MRDRSQARRVADAMNRFTPLSAAIGGILIGLAVALFMLTTGRIAGISGVLDGLIGHAEKKGWRAAFVAGLILAPLLGKFVGFTPPMPQMLGRNRQRWTIRRFRESSRWEVAVSFQDSSAAPAANRNAEASAPAAIFGPVSSRTVRSSRRPPCAATSIV